MNRYFQVIRLVCFASAVILATSTPVTAQGRLPLRKLQNATPFAIAVADSFPYQDANAVIVRRAGAEVPDVVLVRSGAANEHVIGDAVRQLAKLRAASVGATFTEGIFRVQDKGTPWVRQRESKEWVSILARARREPLEGFGDLPHIVLYMPDRPLRQ